MVQIRTDRFMVTPDIFANREYFLSLLLNPELASCLFSFAVFNKKGYPCMRIPFFATLSLRASSNPNHKHR